MKSVGEVMALGRSFPEALQKAIRMLNIGAQGLTSHPYDFDDYQDEIIHATDRRIFAMYEALSAGSTVHELHDQTGIDNWFLSAPGRHPKDRDEDFGRELLDETLLLAAKQNGFADKVIANLTKTTEDKIREQRLEAGIKPVIKQIDTLAGEFDASTNYLYTTYHGNTDDIKPLGKKAVAVLGSGPYCIGSSVEFDWCAVNAGKTLQANGKQTIMINSNPETVSTDFDRSDRLYFEELTLERIRDIADFENPEGIVVSVGGQIANNLALPLAQHDYTILGTSAPRSTGPKIARKFSAMLQQARHRSAGLDRSHHSCKSETLRSKSRLSCAYPPLVRAVRRSHERRQ